MNLKDTARHCPYCMSCGIANPNGDLLCLAHSNRQKHGKGMGFKSKDIHGAILCQRCHDIVDGRVGKLPRHEKEFLHEVAALKTRDWWRQEGYIHTDITKLTNTIEIENNIVKINGTND